MSVLLSPRDQAALELATAEGWLHTPTVDDTAELTPARAVAVALATHLARVQGRIEDGGGPGQRVAFARVLDAWPTGQEPAHYPALHLEDRAVSAWDAQLGIPEVIDGQDVLSADGAWGLWRMGEDTGELVVHIFALHQPPRDALAAAVEQALFGGRPDRLQGLALPLPEAALPPPFHGLLEPARFPRAYVRLLEGARPVEDQDAGAGGVWRADLVVAWQAPRWAARPALPDMQNEITVRVGPPGQETTP